MKFLNQLTKFCLVCVDEKCFKNGWIPASTITKVGGLSNIWYMYLTILFTFKVLEHFLEKNIITKKKLPQKLVEDNAAVLLEVVHFALWREVFNDFWSEGQHSQRSACSFLEALHLIGRFQKFDNA